MSIWPESALLSWKKPDAPQGTVTRPHFPLSSALLCANCEAVYQGEGSQQCPACGSRQAVALGRGALGGRRVG